MNIFSVKTTAMTMMEIDFNARLNEIPDRGRGARRIRNVRNVMTRKAKRNSRIDDIKKDIPIPDDREKSGCVISEMMYQFMWK